VEKDLRKTTLPLAGGIVIGADRTMNNPQAELDPSAIFKTHEDYVSWNKYEEQVDLIKELPDEQKQDLKSDLKYLRRLLGDQFLRSAADEGNPVFFWLFRNTAPHAKRSLMHLARELRSFENANGFTSLIRRLKGVEKAGDALTVLAAASRFRNGGFNISFDPILNQSLKVPDLRLVDADNGEDLYVEVSRLMRGGEQDHNSAIYLTVFNHVLDAIWASPGVDDITKPRGQPYVQILKSISLKELPKLLEEIKETIFSTAIDNKCRERRIRDLVEMVVSPANDHSKAKAWAAARDMRGPVEAPPINLEKELNKAKDKIYRELDQLPPNKPAIVVIPTESFLFFAFEYQHIITGIAEEANYHPNLLCVALLHAVMEGPQESTTVTFGDHALVTMMDDLSTQRTIFVMNENFSLPIAASTIEKVRNAFVTPKLISLQPSG
jgi:hypothetical protein